MEGPCLTVVGDRRRAEQAWLRCTFRVSAVGKDGVPSILGDAIDVVDRKGEAGHDREGDLVAVGGRCQTLDSVLMSCSGERAMIAKPRPLHPGAACANVRHRTRWIPLSWQPVGKLETDRPASAQQRRRGDRSALRRCVATRPARWLRRRGSYLGEREPRFVVLGGGRHEEHRQGCSESHLYSRVFPQVRMNFKQLTGRTVR